MGSIAFSLYSAAWRLAPFLLKKSPRLREGWDERMVRTPLPPCHLWVQAASVGEAFLADELVKAIRNPLPEPLAILLTTNTSQGRQLLERMAADLSTPGLAIHTAYFPLDDPWLMRRAVAQARPLTAVLLESEIWPGFLTACKRANTPTLLVNGRMSARSRDRYRKLPGFFRSLAPDTVLAMSPEDGGRFGEVFGTERVAVMENIKFDRIPKPDGRPTAANPLAGLFPEGAPVAVLGSVREQEEEQVLEIAAGLLAARPDAVAALFPRHMHRLDAWKDLLAGRSIPFALRTELDTPAAPGSVVLWDAFGEMGHAFDLARAVFMGGSLAPLGGQNFLEPLAAGIRPVMGPHWENFAWVGQDIVKAGLLRLTAGHDGVLALLLDDLQHEPDRPGVRKDFEAYAAPRRGGAERSAALVAETLKNAYNARHSEHKPVER